MLLVWFFVLAVHSFAQTKEKSFNVNKGDMLDVSLTNGSITINVWNKDQVYVKAMNIDDKDISTLKMEQRNKKISAEFSGCCSNNFALEVSVPSQFNLTLVSGGGNVTFNGNIDGKVDITIGGGNIKLQDIKNKLSVGTGGGNINIGNIFNEAEISTGGGNIVIGNINGKCDASTGGGNITIGNIGGNADISTAGGTINVSKVTGGAELNTAGGNINLEGASGNVELNTAGGNITAKNISGSIDANTAGGNIYADLIPGSDSKSEFNTAGGDITLTIPSSSNATIIASTNVGKNVSEKDANNFIKSDFESNTVDFVKGRFTKRFIVNGGSAVIELNTAYGKIYIKKK